MSTTTSYPLGYLEENAGYKVVITAILFMFLGTFFVTLRYIARYLGKVPVGVDDYLVAASLVFCLGQGLLSIGRSSCLTGALVMGPTYILRETVFVKRFEFGRHSAALEESNPEDLIVNAKGEIAVDILYCVSCVLPRLAILWLYLRIFPQRSHRMACCITAVVLAGVFSSLAILSGFQCIPLSYLWDKTIAGHCIDIDALFRWSSLPNIVADVVILALPLPAVWKLNAPRNVKVGLAVTFTTGSV